MHTLTLPRLCGGVDNSVSLATIRGWLWSRSAMGVWNCDNGGPYFYKANTCWFSIKWHHCLVWSNGGARLSHKTGPPILVCHDLLFRLWAWRKVLFGSQTRLERERGRECTCSLWVSFFSLCKYSLSLTLEHNKWTKWEPACLEVLSSCLLNSSRPHVDQVGCGLLQVWF